MISNNNNHGRSLDIVDLPTDEYPALTDSTLSMAAAALEPDGTDDSPAETNPEPPAKAALTLTHLEAEVSRLHAKWQTIDAEFANREARIGQLRDEIEARESAIAQLTAAAERDVAALAAADKRLLGKDVEIADLIRVQHARDQRIEKLSQDLADIEGRQKDALEKLAHADTEIARLNDLVLREKAAAAALDDNNRQALAEHDALRSKLQDLEIYINGRHDRWSELNAELVAQKEALRDKEETIKARDAIIGGHDEDKRQLLSSIHDLERQCSELVGRRKEREDAYEELQKKLASHLAQAEQIKGAYATQTKETEQAAKQALDNQQQIESLKRTVEEREQRIEALAAKIEQDKAAVSELATVNANSLKRVDELEIEIARLTAERDTALKESASVRAELDTLGARASELATLHAGAVTEAKALQAALVARNELITKLEAELRAKQATADLLERSVGRITDLGASLAALDERMNGGRKRDAESPISLAAGLATPAADDKTTAAAPLEPPAGVEPRQTDVDAEAPIRIVGVHDRPDMEAARKFVIKIGGQTLDYPIRKKHMTIGRGHDSDIRVPSHFVSRVHAKISTNGVATIIEDAGSKNGVHVNSERVLRRVLRDGDVVSLGDDLNMRFVDAAH